ncbi:hypothetical protein DFJ74DRAFT_691070 [Hyaloraphidium curvatum]|nr:hypothetical protein DFJ74DRAFT_691070 [Hyaloraphidium curvatum]
MLSGNTPATPKELVGMMLAWGLINMGGETPQTVVSSRISQHFRRCAESEPPRKPVLGAWTGLGVRKLRYFVDAPGIPVPEVPKWRLELTVRLREEGDEGKPRPKKAKGEAGAKAAKAAKLDADYSFWGMVTAG